MVNLVRQGIKCANAGDETLGEELQIKEHSKGFLYSGRLVSVA
jgi:hypothetical protein